MANALLTSAIAKQFAILLFMTALGFPQGQPKIVEWSKSPASSETRTAADMRSLDQIDGVEIEDIAVEGKPISIGKNFDAGDDWIRTITFRAKNISGQQLKMVQLTVVLPEMSTGGPDIVFCYGCAKTEREKGIAPGEEIELKILPGDKYYAWVRDKITAQGDISRISKAQIRDMYVILPDGTKLFSDCVKTADPKNACPKDAP